MSSRSANAEPLFAHLVIAVCEDAAGDPATRVILNLRFEARPCPSTPVSLSFYPENADTGTRDSVSCVRIPADCVASLHRTQHGKNWHGPESAPGIDLVRRALGSSRINLVRLQFRLRTHGQLVSPVGLLPAPDNLASLASLAEASVFSVYMPHDACPRATYQGLYRALRPFLDSPAAPQADLVSEPPPYSTTGEASSRNKDTHKAVESGAEQEDRTTIDGEASAPRQVRSLRPESIDSEYGPSPLPGSDNDTVAVTTPSGFDSTDDGHLPEHTHSKSRASTAPEVIYASKRPSRSSSSPNTANAPRRRTKRPRWSPKPDNFFETEPSSSGLCADLPSTQSVGFNPGLDNEPAAPMDLYQRVARLEFANRTLVEENKTLRERVEELECLSLEVEEFDSRINVVNEHYGILETRVESVEVQYHELEEDCSRLDRLLAAERGLAKDEMYDYVEDLVQQYMETALGDFKAEFKTKLRRLLDD